MTTRTNLETAASLFGLEYRESPNAVSLETELEIVVHAGSRAQAAAELAALARKVLVLLGETV